MVRKKKQQQPKLYPNNFIKTLLYSDKIDDEWFSTYEKDIKTIMKYIWDIFRYSPAIINVVYPIVTSYEFNTFKLREQVEYLQKVLKETGIAFSELFFFRKDFTKKDRQDYMKFLSDSDFGDLQGLYALHKLGFLNLDNLEQDNKVQHVKKISKDDKDKIIESVKDFEEREIRKSEPVIAQLTQEIIDDLELILFDIAILQKYNQIIYTFIDKDNKKVIYKEHFSMQFYWHAEPDLLKKDYFEDNHKLYPYIMNESSYLYKFNQAIRESFKRSCRQVSKSKTEEVSWF